MTPSEWFVQPAGRVLTLALVHFVWQGLAIGVALVALVELCGIRRAGARYACSLAALITMTACPLFTLACLTLSPQSTMTHIAAVAGRGPSQVDFLPGGVSGAVALEGPWLELASPYVLAVWFSGVALLGGRLLGGALGLRQLCRDRLPLPPKITAIVERLGDRLRLDALSLVFLSRRVTEAMAVGLVRPLVLIPAAWATELPVEMLEAIIAHELAHLRRRDLWVNLLQRIVETLLFYHPAVWWLSRRLRVERELCADELAVEVTGKRLEYARTLEQLAGGRQADLRPALAAFLRGETNMHLLHRVRNVLEQTPGQRSRLWPAGIVALALPLGLWVAAAVGGPALADDEDQEERQAAVKRQRAENEEERRIILRKQEQRREAREGSRDEKPAQIEEREERRIIRKRGEPDQILERKVITRDGKPVVEIELGRDADRGKGGDRRIDELTALVKRLSAQVERLQDEVARLRDGSPSDAPKRETEQRKEAEIQLRKAEAAAKKIENAKRQEAEEAETIKLKRIKAREEQAEQWESELKERLIVEKERAAVEKAQAARDKATSDLETLLERKLRELKENDPEGYREALLRKLRDKQSLIGGEATPKTKKPVPRRSGADF